MNAEEKNQNSGEVSRVGLKTYKKGKRYSE